MTNAGIVVTGLGFVAGGDGRLLLPRKLLDDLIAEKTTKDSFVMLPSGERCNGIGHEVQGVHRPVMIGPCTCDPAEVAAREIT